MHPGRDTTADKASHRRRADHTEGADGECRHRPGHALAGAIHLADLVYTEGFGQIAGAEEQRDLH
jgi:hypothetical protein